jgi:hypothetical protein
LWQKKGRIPFGVKVLISDIKTGSAYALMKNHIYSTFDLSKSLENFQEQVTKLLELKNISEWNGTKKSSKLYGIKATALKAIEQWRRGQEGSGGRP